MNSENQKSDPMPRMPEQAEAVSVTEADASGLPRRSLLKGATIAAATLGAFGGLTLPASAASATNATVTTPNTSMKRLSPKTQPKSFKYELEAANPQVFAGGTNRTATAENLKELESMSLFSQRIDPGAMRELHWHPNASELNYCLSGQGEIGIFLSDKENAVFAIGPGSVSFVPNGTTHYIRNTGTDVLHMIVAFTHEDPEHIDFSDSLGQIPRKLLAQTFSLPTESFPALPIQDDQFLVKTGQLPTNPPSSSATGPYTVDINTIPPKVLPGGTLNELTTKQIPALQGITLFLLKATPGALREPHWHPNASELNYCVQGGAQIEIIAPDEERETFTVQPGDVAFIPQNYFHYVAGNPDGPLTLLVFFSNNVVGHIDFSQITTFFQRGLLAASFGSDQHLFDSIPNLGDVFIAK